MSLSASQGGSENVITPLREQLKRWCQQCSEGAYNRKGKAGKAVTRPTHNGEERAEESEGERHHTKKKGRKRERESEEKREVRAGKVTAQTKRSELRFRLAAEQRQSL